MRPWRSRVNGEHMRAFVVLVVAMFLGCSLPDAPQIAERQEQEAPKPAPDTVAETAVAARPARATSTTRAVPPPAPESRVAAPTTDKQAKVEVARPVAPATSTAKALAPEPPKREPVTTARAVAKAPAAPPEPSETRMYLCRDGTVSPTCVCGGPKRGCCSHHGGVVGCSANRRN